MKKEKNDVSEKDKNTQENNEVNSSEKDLEIKENNKPQVLQNTSIKFALFYRYGIKPCSIRQYFRVIYKPV